MSNEKGSMTPEQVRAALDSLSSGVDNVDGILCFVVGNDPDSGKECLGGGMAGRFSLKELEGLHLSVMRATVKALVTMTGMDARNAEMMLAVAVVTGAKAGMYSSQDGITDRSLELAESLGADTDSKEATASILAGIMGSAGSKLN